MLATCELLKKLKLFNFIVSILPEHLQTIVPHLQTSKQLFLDLDEFANFFDFQTGWNMENFNFFLPNNI